MMVEDRNMWEQYFCVFYVNFNVFFKLIKVHLLVSELYIYQNAWCNDKKKMVDFIAATDCDPPKNCNNMKYTALLILLHRIHWHT